MEKVGLVEEARKQYKGQYTDKTQWNKVVVGNSEYTVERGRVSRGKINLDEIKWSPAFEKKPHKEICGLCRMYFEKSSLTYKVPNHRIVDKQKEWSLPMTGRRYESASFLYSTSNLCKFCAHLMGDVHSSQMSLSKVDFGSSGCDGVELKAFGSLERSDIAENQRAYQSSVVDKYQASLAVTPEVESTIRKQMTRTRREADPWWEVDLGRPQHVFAISFSVLSSIRQKLPLTIICLTRPVGFEDPFLDSVRDSPDCVAKKEVLVRESDFAALEQIEWELPPSTTCSAIRVQAKGIFSLQITKFRAFQGDDLVLCEKEDFEKTAISYASVSPGMLRESIRDMLSPVHRRQKVKKQKNSSGFQGPGGSVDLLLEAAREKRGRFSDLKGVGRLSKHIELRKQAADQFFEKIMKFVEFFTKDELLTQFRILFLPAVEESPQLNENRAPLSENDIFDKALIQHYPRADLIALQEQVKSLLRKLQARNHSKAIESLLASEKFVPLANELDDSLYKLYSAFKKVEKHWKKEQQRLTREREKANKEAVLVAVACGQFEEAAQIEEDAQKELEAAANSGRGTPSTAPVNTNVASKTHFVHATRAASSRNLYRATSYFPEVREKLGCSWAQFCMIMALFCTQQTTRIPALVYGIEKDTMTEYFPSWTLPGNGTGGTRPGTGTSRPAVDDADSVSVVSNHSGAGVVAGVKSPPNLSDVGAGKLSPAIRMGGETLTIGLAEACRRPLHCADKCTCAAQEEAAISHTLKEMTKDPLKPVFQSGFAEYKLDNVVRKQMVDLPFPKTLRADFDVTMVELPRAGLLRRLKETKLAQTAPSGSSSSFADLFGGSQSMSLASKTMPQGEVSAENSLVSLASVGSISMPSDVLAEPRQSSRPVLPTDEAMAAVVAAGGTASLPPEIREAVNTAKSNHRFGFDKSDSVVGGSEDEPEDNIGFFKVCALCEQRHPKRAMEISVLWKHVIALRRHWDPNLVSKELELLDQSISMYNFVRVCVFCAQFFDPDFPDGIAAPNREIEMEKLTGLQATLTATIRPNKVLVPFFDHRFPSVVDIGSSFLHEPRVLESRARARRAVQLAQELRASSSQGSSFKLGL